MIGDWWRRRRARRRAIEDSARAICEARLRDMIQRAGCQVDELTIRRAVDRTWRQHLPEAREAHRAGEIYQRLTRAG
ncbi:MAG TPA: hypothetical protein VF194_06325 [Ferrovibrio sp.]|uniref:hypothetical protein n=1 Tax=Ferrovibrio sp. TaxID=1917215 RepID=UPI002ED1CA83